MKKGMWRIQDNGHIREYRKYGNDGLRDGVDPNLQSIDIENRNIIKHQYTHYKPDEPTLYKLPKDKVKNGYLQYIDLTIYHPKYNHKYDNHVPIDLAHFYCSLSQGGYKHMQRAWQYATKQKAMNQIGPLGKRAGKCSLLLLLGSGPEGDDVL